MAFRSAHRYWKFKPRDGLAVLARGRIDVYEARGEYQLLVETLEPQGLGALQLAFEQLKKKLAAEGLFAAERKRPLPRFPRRIGIVTSPRGAAIADMVKILTRRFPGLHIRLFPALVQGEGSVEEVCRGIEYFSRSAVGRPGHRGPRRRFARRPLDFQRGSRGARHRRLLRAGGLRPWATRPTSPSPISSPTCARPRPRPPPSWPRPRAQEVEDRVQTARAQSIQALRYRLAMLERRLRQQGIDRAAGALRLRMGRAQQRIDDLGYRMRDRIRASTGLRERRRRALEDRLRRFDMRPRLAAARRGMEAASAAADRCIRMRLALRRSAWERAAAKLGQLSPLRILERGYAIVSNESGVLKDAALAPPGSGIRVRLARGRLDAVVERQIPES